MTNKEGGHRENRGIKTWAMDREDTDQGIQTVQTDDIHP